MSARRRTTKRHRPGDGCWYCVGRPRRFTAAEQRRLAAAEQRLQRLRDATEAE